MFKLYSKGCEYALRALTYAASRSENGRFQAKEICEKAGIPESFTRKVFQALTQGGFLQAVRGPGGGYELTRPANEITLLDVIVAVEGEDTFEHCVMGLPTCGSSTPCPLHDTWARGKCELMAQLRRQTLQDFAAVPRRKRGKGRTSGPLSGR